MIGIQEGGAMHLAGQADTPYLRHRLRSLPGEFDDRAARRLYPARRVLLRPAVMWPLYGQRRVRGGDRRLPLVDQQGLEGRGTEIEPEIICQQRLP